MAYVYELVNTRRELREMAANHPDSIALVVDTDTVTTVGSLIRRHGSMIPNAVLTWEIRTDDDGSMDKREDITTFAEIAAVLAKADAHTLDTFKAALAEKGVSLG